MYAPPAVGYALIVWRYERIRKPRTTSRAIVTGTTSANAATPTYGTRCRRISSVAYADDDRLSEAKTASAVGLPRRSCSSCSVSSGGPSSLLLARYDRLSGGSSDGEKAGSGFRSSGDDNADAIRV